MTDPVKICSLLHLETIRMSAPVPVHLPKTFVFVEHVLVSAYENETRIAWRSFGKGKYRFLPKFSGGERITGYDLYVDEGALAKARPTIVVERAYAEAI